MFLGLDINADSLFRPLCVGPIKVVLLVNFTVHTSTSRDGCELHCTCITGTSRDGCELHCTCITGTSRDGCERDLSTSLFKSTSAPQICYLIQCHTF